jgi:hypothetical protein
MGNLILRDKRHFVIYLTVPIGQIALISLNDAIVKLNQAVCCLDCKLHGSLAFGIFNQFVWTRFFQILILEWRIFSDVFGMRAKVEDSKFKGVFSRHC